MKIAMCNSMFLEFRYLSIAEIVARRTRSFGMGNFLVLRLNGFLLKPNNRLRR
tara:strand:+ start:4493 stop:4651 length:159 start_codon:yes stop_codon:yes gene_type:complete